MTGRTQTACDQPIGSARLFAGTTYFCREDKGHDGPHRLDLAMFGPDGWGDHLASITWTYTTDDERGMPMRVKDHGLASGNASLSLVERAARALAEANDDGCFDGEHEDPEMWEANAEDRDYSRRLARAALSVLSDAARTDS